MKTCIACSANIPRGEGTKRFSFWLCESCEPKANSICTSKHCDCLDEGSTADECVCRVNGLGKACAVCLEPMVFIDVNTGKRLEQTS